MRELPAIGAQRSALRVVSARTLPDRTQTGRRARRPASAGVRTAHQLR
ncbi:hypothetical protein ABMC88_16760 [Sulfitobacter sp. HNIBRBA2951]